MTTKKLENVPLNLELCNPREKEMMRIGRKINYFMRNFWDNEEKGMVK
jgi:hypothetical protein